MGQLLHELGQYALTWLPIIFFGLIIYLLWRTLQYMPRVKPQAVEPTAASSVTWDDVAGVKEAQAAGARCSEVEIVLNELDAARAALRAEGADDDDIRRAIREGTERWGQVWDPHTATAVAVRERLPGEGWIIVSTAHPAKFEAIVEPLVGREVPVPAELQALLDRPSHVTEIDPTLDAFRKALG